MRIHHFLLVQCKTYKVWILGFVAFFVTLGCGGGGGGGSPSGLTPFGMHKITATISAPTGEYFNEGENINFSGDGKDADGIPIIGDALLWTSSIDGPIGYGSTLITSALSAGEHKITLSASDSEGDTYTTPPISINVEHTRFIKMGFQPTDIGDASNAFDGDHDTAATIMVPDSEYLYFKSYIGGSDAFFFGVTVGPSVSGSSLSLEGMDTDGDWLPVGTIDLSDSDMTAAVNVDDAQNYKDADGYINLRISWVNDQGPGTVSIYELNRLDPVYSGPKTTGIEDTGNAFDDDRSSFATVTEPWDSGSDGPFLQFRSFVGAESSGVVKFSLLLNSIGSDQLLIIDVEDVTTAAPNTWTFVQSLTMDTTEERTVIVEDVQNYLDADGCISLRARWVNLNTKLPKNNARIYDIERLDHLFIGAKTSFDWIANPSYSVDGNLNTYSRIDYYWGEEDHEDFLHFQTYVGDSLLEGFSIKTGASEPGSFLIIEGEYEPNYWSEIARISLDGATTTKIDLTNPRDYVLATGCLSIRARWYADSPHYDATIEEIWR